MPLADPPVPATGSEPSTAAAAESAETVTICSYYLKGKCRFGDDCFNSHPPELAPVENTQAEKNSNKGKKTNKRKSIEKEITEKKAPMKTAGEVRKRIQWDPDLKEEYFTVGYLDRFSGVVEKPFTAFTWQHLATVDLDQLAVPQHRIQYFKYRGVTVWDKGARLDYVFGSTGGDTTIQKIVTRLDEEEERRSPSFDPDDEDSDDDVVVVGGGANPGSGLVATLTQGQRPVDEPLRATHFFCIRVDDDTVKSLAAQVQEAVVTEEPVLRSCAMPGELLHVTLAMVRLDTPEAVIAAVQLLQALQAQVAALISSDSDRAIRARGLATFGSRVLYAKLDVPPAFETVIEIVHEGLRSARDATITNNFEFVPHMTLLKVNRPTARERRSKYLDSRLYDNFLHTDFGTINFNNINLCVIDDMRAPDGFYVTCQRIEF